MLVRRSCGGYRSRVLRVVWSVSVRAQPRCCSRVQSKEPSPLTRPRSVWRRRGTMRPAARRGPRGEGLEPKGHFAGLGEESREVLPARLRPGLGSERRRLPECTGEAHREGVDENAPQGKVAHLEPGLAARARQRHVGLAEVEAAREVHDDEVERRALALVHGERPGEFKGQLLAHARTLEVDRLGKVRGADDDGLAGGEFHARVEHARLGRGLAG
mmetsp:Transcript_27250/g.80140  ORF Transcript_27250/g.80140 Transcript_27250/m.80140 type:complete len:216 (-) Transcript_27250:1536-2183(-)